MVDLVVPVVEGVLPADEEGHLVEAEVGLVVAAVDAEEEVIDCFRVVVPFSFCLSYSLFVRVPVDARTQPLAIDSWTQTRHILWHKPSLRQVSGLFCAVL